MKRKLIALLSLSALLLSPALAAPRKMKAEKSKTSSAAATAKETLPARQAEARKLAAALTTTQKSKMLALLNEGTGKDLAAIRGVSRSRAAAISDARPFEQLDEVILVSGIGQGTFAGIVEHARSLTARTKKASSSSSSPKKKPMKAPSKKKA